VPAESHAAASQQALVGWQHDGQYGVSPINRSFRSERAASAEIEQSMQVMGP
jgi:hypothetical protein